MKRTCPDCKQLAPVHWDGRFLSHPPAPDPESRRKRCKGSHKRAAVTLTDAAGETPTDDEPLKGARGVPVEFLTFRTKGGP